MQEIRYTDDLKDAVVLSQREARRARHNNATDRDTVIGLLQTRRKFNRLDAILSSLKAPSIPILKQLQTGAGLQRPTLDATASSQEHVLRQAESLAQSDHAGQAPSSPVTVDVEHLLKALTLSPDPAVRKALADYHITADSVDNTLPTIERSKVQRSALFIGKELLEVVLFVLVFLIIIKSVFGELRLIPSESMVPGLQINDRLVIERLTHWARPYQRGDVLVFYPPMTELKKDPISLFMRVTGFSGLIYKKEDNIDVAYIKRLIGLPGDTVDVRPDDGVYVNGKKLDEPYVNEIAATCTWEPSSMHPDRYCGSVKVPPNSYFMMGDNRNMSLDSRYWGFAQESRVIGRAVFRIWPPSRIGKLGKAPYQP